MKSVLKKNLDNYPWIKKKKNALLPIILLRLDDSLGKKVRFEGSVGKMAVKPSLLKGNETSWDVAALWKILAHENGQQWKGGIQLTSFFFLWGKSCLECHPLLRGDCNTGQWETHLQWETKRFALLTSCWLPVELHLVVVAFGFAVACHQMALGWWIHFQGNYIGTFWQWHLPNAWKQ